MEHLNDWEVTLGEDVINKEKEFNLETIYKHTHSEMSLQQSKRDQLITIYIALFSFILPFALSLDSVGLWVKGGIFLVVGIVGVLFSAINVQYRVWKEVYWLSCQAITVLMNVKKEALNKKTVQSAFFHALNKKGKGSFVEEGGKKVWSKKKFIKRNSFGTETLHHVTQVLITAVICALSVALIAKDVFDFSLGWILLFGAAVLIVMFGLMMRRYFKKLMEVYSVLSYVPTGAAEVDKKERDRRFNLAFARAWTLHVYY